MNNEENLTDKKKKINLGEIFYPGFNHIVTELVEISPILNKPYPSNRIYSLIELFFKLIYFVFCQKINDGYKDESTSQNSKKESILPIE
jgi:hypothetical protein